MSIESVYLYLCFISIRNSWRFVYAVFHGPLPKKWKKNIFSVLMRAACCVFFSSSSSFCLMFVEIYFRDYKLYLYAYSTKHFVIFWWQCIVCWLLNDGGNDKCLMRDSMRYRYQYYMLVLVIWCFQHFCLWFLYGIIDVSTLHRLNNISEMS